MYLVPEFGFCPRAIVLKVGVQKVPKYQKIKWQNNEIKQFVVTNSKYGATWVNGNRNSKKRNVDTNRYIKKLDLMILNI